MYICEFCDEPIEEREKAKFLPAGEWQPTAEPKDKLSIGFHISGALQPAGMAILGDYRAGHGKSRKTTLPSVRVS